MKSAIYLNCLILLLLTFSGAQSGEHRLFSAFPRARLYEFWQFQPTTADSPKSLGFPASSDHWWGEDKANHFLVCLMVSSSSYLGMQAQNNDRNTAFVSSLGGTIGLGAAKEIFDLFVPNHTPSWKDLVADALGAVCGSLVARAL